MADYLDLDLGSLDAEEVRQQGRDYMTAQAPAGWVINPWLDWLLGAVARMSVLVLTLAGQVPRAIFKAFLTDILGIPIAEATAATGNVTVHASANRRRHPARRCPDRHRRRRVRDDRRHADDRRSGHRQRARPGRHHRRRRVRPDRHRRHAHRPDHGLGRRDHAQRANDRRQRRRDRRRVRQPRRRRAPHALPKAILIEDAAAIARADIEVFRALAIDNLVPPSTTGVAGAITVAIMAADGGNVSGPGKTRVETALEAGRILAIDAHVIDPTQNAMKVSFTATARAGYDPAATAAEAKQAIQDFLSPLGWGVPPGDNGTGWTDEPTVVRNDLFGVLYGIEGIRHVSALTLALSAGTLGTTDVTLTGPPPCRRSRRATSPRR
jgi:hypothetical protein